MITQLDPDDRDLTEDATSVLADAGYTLTRADDYEPTQADRDEAAAWANS